MLFPDSYGKNPKKSRAGAASRHCNSNMDYSGSWSYETHQRLYNTPGVTTSGRPNFIAKDRHDSAVKTISYPTINKMDESGLVPSSTRTYGPLMTKMREKVIGSTVIDRTLTRATEFKISIANGLENSGTIGRARRTLNCLNQNFKRFVGYIGFANGNRTYIGNKVRERHLELEPLCCLSSCLVRGGCTTVVVFEVAYIVLTLLVCAVKIYDSGRWKFWEVFEPNFNAIITHQLFLYILMVFDLMTIFMVFTLLRGLLRFDKILVRRHWHFDFFALGFNLVAFVLFLLGVSSQGPEVWTFDNVLLIICFAEQVFLQLWAISVVKSCYDFFVLLHVFIHLAET